MSIFSQTQRCLLNQRSNIFVSQKRFSILECIHRHTSETNNFSKNHMVAICQPNVRMRFNKILDETCQITINKVNNKLHSMDKLLVKDILDNNNNNNSDFNHKKYQPKCSWVNTLTKFAYGNLENNRAQKNNYSSYNDDHIKNHSYNYKHDYKHHYKQRSQNNYNHNHYQKYQPHHGLVSMLAGFGIFKKMTTGDIDEEKAKLSDEQKIIKMKPIEILIAKGVLSMCDQDYTKANELFHKALQISQDDEDEEQETLILNLLASNFFEGGDLENAEKLFIDIMKRMIANNVEQTDPAILELSLKLASIYSKNKSTHEKAFKGFKFVITSLLAKLQDIVINVEDIDIKNLSEDKKDQLALLGWSYDWFAKHLLSINDYNGATDMLKKALEISSKVLGPTHDQTLILLNDVGTTMAMNNEPEEGKTFLHKAVEGAIEGQSKELASFYVNLGLVNLKLRKLNDAKRYCEYSIELASKNSEHHNSSDILKLSRHCLSEVKRLEKIVN